MEFKPLSEAWIADPYPHFARIRDSGGVLWSANTNSHVFARYSDCADILRRSADFIADPARLGREVPAVRRNIQTIDPPDNGPLRKVTADSFRAGTGGLFEDRLRAEVNSRLAVLARTPGTVNLVTQFSVPLCLSASCELIGLDQPDPEWFEEVSERLVRGMDYGFRPQAAGPALKAREELSALISAWLRDGSDSPFRHGITRATTGLPDEVMANTIRVVFHASYSSLSRFLENLLYLLLSRPDVFRRFAPQLTDASGLARAAHEVIRYDSPVQAVTRLAARDMPFGGVSLVAGDAVTALIGAANRDPEIFADASSLILDRHPNPHLSFGRGPHGCLGAGLAVTVGSLVLSTFLSTYPGSRLRGPAVRRECASLRGFAALPAQIR